VAQPYTYTNIPNWEMLAYKYVQAKAYGVKHNYTKIQVFPNSGKHKYPSTIKLSALKASYAI
jgi:hypothetical protein